MRVICVVAGHKWTPASEAPDPQDANAVRVPDSYAGDAVLVCRRCGHQKVISPEDLQPDGYLIGGPVNSEGDVFGGPRQAKRP